MEFRLVSLTNDGKEIELGNISEITYISNQLSEGSTDLVNIRATENLSFNCSISPTLALIMGFEYYKYRNWNDEILQQLTIICDPRRLDSYLSEYQYLNPLF